MKENTPNRFLSNVPFYVILLTLSVQIPSYFHDIFPLPRLVFPPILRPHKLVRSGVGGS